MVAVADGPELDALRSGLTLVEGARRRVRRTWLDTFDWRLDRAGARLEYSATSGAGSELVLRYDDGESLRQTGSVSWPAFADQLPAGPLRERLAPIVEMRALLPLVRVAGTVREFSVLNAESKTVARLVVEQFALAEAPGTPLRPRLRIVPVRGYDKYAARIAKELAGAGAGPGDRAQLVEALGEIGRNPRDYLGKVDVSMPPSMPASVAVGAVLGEVFTIAESNVDGIVGDLDTEFLHDFRVAVRRTRAVLKLAGEVLPGDLVTRFAPEFKWLGDLTTPTRDLDVYLLGFTDLGGGLELPRLAELEPLRAFLGKRRRVEQRKLVRGLRSDRFAALLKEWPAALAEVLAAQGSSGSARPTAAELAEDRVARAHRRVVKLGSSITPGSPAAALHDLRKRGKELRYVLDLFSPLYDASAHRKVIGELKRLQDCLGTFQDSEVQHEAVRGFAAQMMAAGSAPADTVLAMGELGARLEQHKAEARRDFAERFARFVRPKNTGRILQLATVDSQ